jgi:hypothetical protein
MPEQFIEEEIKLLGEYPCVTGPSFSSVSSQTAHICHLLSHNYIAHMSIYKLSRYYMSPLQRTGTDLVYYLCLWHLICFENFLSMHIFLFQYACIIQFVGGSLLILLKPNT